MLKEIWKKILTVIIILGVILSFFAVIELMRAYQVLNEVHPALGLAYVLLLAALVLFGIIYYLISVARRPAILTPPKVTDLSEANGRDLIVYGNYLVKLMLRLSGNVGLPGGRRADLKAESKKLNRVIKNDAKKDELTKAIREAIETQIEPCFQELDSKAEREVQSCVRDVMIGVAVSPWRAVDLLVVLYRNVRMVLGVISVYDNRPAPRAQLRIFGDIVKIIATVNILNYGSRLAQNLFASIPFAGRFVDDIAQGVGAGFFTSMAGHSAIERCSNCYAWSEAEAQKKISEKAKDFAGDLKSVVTEDVWPLLKERVKSSEGEDKAVMLEQVKSGIDAAMDKTSSAMGDFVKKPAVAVGAGVAGTGRVMFEATKKGGKATLKGAGKAGVIIGKGVRIGGGLAARVSGKSKHVITTGLHKFKKRKSKEGDSGDA